jgi:hypothetical protein
MATPLPDYIAIVTPTPIHGGYGLEIYCHDADKVSRFETWCKLNLLGGGAWFFQGGVDSQEWKYFEYWGEPTLKFQDWLLQRASCLATQLELTLTIR